MTTTVTTNVKKRTTNLCGPFAIEPIIMLVTS